MTRRSAWRLAGLCAVAAGARTWSFLHASVRMFTDSIDYARQSHDPLLSARLWAGYKPPLTPLLIKLAGSAHAYTVLQLTLAIACWSLLAVVAARVVSARSWLGGAAAAAGVLALSLTQPVAQWDRAVLTESVAFSLLAALVALGILVARKATWLHVSGFLVVLGAWVGVRDSDATAVAFLGAVLLGGVLLRRFDRRAGVIAAGAMVLVALSFGSASVGNRNFYPIAQTLRVRILNTPGGLHWLKELHAPQVETVSARRREAVESLPGFGPWQQWIRSDGQKAVLIWLVEHPSQIFTAPLGPNQGIANAPTRYYAPHGYCPALGRLDALIWPVGWAIPGIMALTLALVLIHYRPAPSPLVAVALLCAFAALPHAWAAWLLNPMEISRHALVAELQLRMAAVLAAPVALAGVLDRLAEIRQRADSGSIVSVPAFRAGTSPVGATNAADFQSGV